MGQAIPSQHPAVVLRSHYAHLRALLAIAMIAVIGLSIAVVILVSNDGRSPGATPATAVRSDSAPTEFRVPSHAREHAGAPVPDLRVAPLPHGQRYDGGPDEGTRGIVATQPPNVRDDGGPDEGSRGPGR
jgi:hypothetical protein